VDGTLHSVARAKIHEHVAVSVENDGIEFAQVLRRANVTLNPTDWAALNARTVAVCVACTFAIYR